MLRVLPWITDDAVRFIDGLICDRQKKSVVTVFEFGAGNSTLYFLNRGCMVTAIDHDNEWLHRIEVTAEVFGMGSMLNAKLGVRPYASEYVHADYDIISIDGRDRVQCLEEVLKYNLNCKTVLILDNTERVTDGKYQAYSEILSQDFNCIHFEHPSVRGVHPRDGNYYARSGARVPHRWITTIAFKKGLSFTTAGSLL